MATQETLSEGNIDVLSALRRSLGKLAGLFGANQSKWWESLKKGPGDDTLFAPSLGLLQKVLHSWGSMGQSTDSDGKRAQGLMLLHVVSRVPAEDARETELRAGLIREIATSLLQHHVPMDRIASEIRSSGNAIPEVVLSKAEFMFSNNNWQGAVNILLYAAEYLLEGLDVRRGTPAERIPVIRAEAQAFLTRAKAYGASERHEKYNKVVRILATTP